MTRKWPEPTPEDRERVEQRLADPNAGRDELKEILVRNEAWARVQRERQERRRRFWRRLLGPFAPAS